MAQLSTSQRPNLPHPLLSDFGLPLHPEVGDEGEMVGGEGGAGQPLLPDLLAGGHLEDGLALEAALRVEDVVERLLVLAVLADLPRRVLRVLGGVGRAQAENASVVKSLID